MTNYDVVKKLIGEIYPVGETHTDDRRFENLKEMIELVDKLLTDIDKVAYRNKDRVEFSMKRAGGCAKEFLDKLGLPE